MNKYFVLLFTLALFASCQKELSFESGELPEISEEQAIENFVTAKKFQLRRFYSDIAIDYIETDSQVKQETNLWGYVSEHLKDDVNIFLSTKGNVDVVQNAVKLTGVEDPILHRTYQIGSDSEGIFMMFLDANYNSFKYRFHETGEDYFILALKWSQGATLFSKFEMVP